MCFAPNNKVLSTKHKDLNPKAQDQNPKTKMKPMTDLRNASLAEVDPVIARAIDNEVARQANGLELIASENFVSEAVLGQ